MNRTLVEKFHDTLEKEDLKPVSVEIHRGSVTFKWSCSEQALRFTEVFQEFCSVYVREISGPKGKLWITLAIADGGRQSRFPPERRGSASHLRLVH